MRHTNYYQVKAQTHFELGYKLAQLFKTSSLELYSSILKNIPPSRTTYEMAHKCLEISTDYFPQYVEELKGYASGLEVDFSSFWLTFLSEELKANPEKCTSCFSKDGTIIGHNEDFSSYFEDKIAFIEKTIDGLTIFEVYYYNSLGGAACSVNSHGYIQTINTLHHTDQQIGVPRNIIARWLSETSNPQSDFEKMRHIKRALGYSHTFSNVKGDIMNFESSATQQQLVAPQLPYVHTNHCLTKLSIIENKKAFSNTIDRYNEANKQIESINTVEDMQNLLEEISKKYPNDTIARMVFDLQKKTVWCWLQREASLGWVEYPLQFL